MASTALYCAKPARARSEAALTSRLLGEVPVGAIVTVLDAAGCRRYVDFRGRRGWVSAKCFLDPDAAFAAAGGEALREFGDAAFLAWRATYAHAETRRPPPIRATESAAPRPAAAPPPPPPPGIAAQLALTAARSAPGRRRIVVAPPTPPFAVLGFAAPPPETAVLARAIRDGVAPPRVCATCLGAVLLALRRARKRGGRSKVAPDDPDLAPWRRLFRDIIEACRAAAADALGIRGALAYAGGYATRLSAADDDGSYEYWRPHVDARNNPSVAVSCVLYLNTASIGFEGGAFEFVDADADRAVAPVAGRLLAFTSGDENAHRVARVTAGDRVALATFFTLAR